VHLLAFFDYEGQLPAMVASALTMMAMRKALLERVQMRALVIEQIKRGLGARAHGEIVGRALEQHFVERAQKLQRDRRHRAHMAGAAAMRHFSVELSSTLERMRWRDISSSPKCEMCPTWMRARSCRRHSFKPALDPRGCCASRPCR